MRRNLNGFVLELHHLTGSRPLGRIRRHRIHTSRRHLHVDAGRRSRAFTVPADKTWLAGTFDLTAEWTPTFQPPPPPGSPADASPVAPDAAIPPGQFTALAEQLGLKFECDKGPIDVLIIDRVERPSPD